MFSQLTTSLQGIFGRFRGHRVLLEKDVTELVAQVTATLVAADVPQEIIERMINAVRQEAIGMKLVKGVHPDQQFMKVLDTQLTALLGKEEGAFAFRMPATIMVVGLQGSGKTTTLGKLVRMLSKSVSPQKIMMSSLDFQRPAAREQLQLLAQRLGVTYFDPVSRDVGTAAREVMAYRKQKGFVACALDTAGRLHTDAALLQELQNIVAVVQPEYRILVLDGMMGQSSLAVASAFHKALDITGGIITKADSNAPAGVVLAFRSAVQKPLLFLGMGEGLADLEPVIPKRLVKRLLGEGDLAALCDKAQEVISQAEEEAAKESLKQGLFTIDDFQKQMSMMDRMGSLSSIGRYLPASLGLQVTEEKVRALEVELKRHKAIISSMASKERLTPQLLRGGKPEAHSRRMRLARGAGVSEKDVRQFLTKFEEMKQCAMLLKDMKMPW